MLLALSLLGLGGLIFIATLLIDGVRVLLQRRRREARSRPLELIVAGRREATDRHVHLTLACAKSGRLPAFAAGQHVLLQAPAGQQGKTVQRAYSLAAWTARPQHYELGIKREAQGAVSGWAWETLQPGQRIQVLPPKGDFVLRAPGTKAHGELVLIGGGIGITPLRAMLHAALDASAPSGAPRIVLFHAARSAAELLYHDEFTALAAADRRFDYHPLLSRPDPDWLGACGRLDAARILQGLQQAADADFYLCAGAGLMDALCSGLAAAGISAAHIHRESFGVPLAAATTAPTGNAGQRISIERDGQRRELIIAGEPTLLAALEAHDLAPHAECRAGSCGACCMRLVDGEVRWLLTPEHAVPAGKILPCVCAAVGDVRLAAN